MNKRGDVETQFNWIFVLIAGAVILAIFIAVASTLKKGSDEKIQVEVSSDLRTTLVGIKVGQSATKVPLPTVGMRLGCDGLKVGQLESVKMSPIFGPTVMTGNTLLAWSKDWAIPMRLENFLYVTTPKVKYLFVSDTEGLMDELVKVEGIEQLNKELVECSALPAAIPGDTLDVTIVEMRSSSSTACMSPTLSPSLSTRKGAVMHVTITPDNSGSLALEDAVREGTVVIDDLKIPGPSPTPIAYRGDAMMYGAIFAGSQELYACMTNLAYKNAQMILRTYALRLPLLQSEGGVTECDYGNAITEVNGLVGHLDCSTTTCDWTTDLEDGFNAIDDRNRDFEDKSCPTIY